MLDKMRSMYESDLAKALQSKPETAEQWAHICWLEKQLIDIEGHAKSQKTFNHALRSNP